MRKTYIIDEPKVIHKLTFIKNLFSGKKYVEFGLVKVKLKNHRGFSDDIATREEAWGSLNIKDGKVLSGGYSLIKDNESFIRKQWLKHKEDFLKSK